MTEICRTCLQQVSDSSVIFYLNAVDSQSETITIRCKLADCVPEMDLDVVPNAFICNSCFESLMVAHEFKNKCLETEGRIQSYIEQMGYVLTSVNLREIVQQSRLTTDVKSSSFFDYTKNSSHDTARTTLYDTNENSIDGYAIKESKEKSLDLKNLQCDTRAFFAVPKIAQLLAEGEINYKCNQCCYKASSEHDLKLHEESHQKLLFTAPKITGQDNGTSFKCTQCTYIASSDLDLISHEENHFVSQKPHKCDTQDYFPTPKFGLLLNEGNFCSSRKCTQCTYTASSDIDLKSHEESHFTQKLHKCTQCDYSAPKRQTLIIHMRKHSMEKPYNCDDNYNTPFRDNLMQHLRLHTNEKLDNNEAASPLQCELSEFKGRLKFDLKNRMREHAGEKPYKCLLCDYSSSHKTNLGYHMRVHNGEKPYKCKLCDYKSSQKTNLQNHMRMHTGKKSFKCTKCNYTTVHNKSLTSHMRNHTGNKSYSCTFCNYTSLTKMNLIKHLMTHTGELPHHCFDCGYRGVTKSDLERHLSTHTIICTLCEKTFGNLENLRRHTKQHVTSMDSTIDAVSHVSRGASESTSDNSEAHASAEYEINTEKNNCDSAVKKEMII